MLDKHMDQWSEHDFLRRAYMHARTSPDTSTQCGAILVPNGNQVLQSTLGTNRFPPGVKCTPELLADRDKKIFRIQHAERDCIMKAAARGTATFGATMYCPWFACSWCAQDIICAGIKRMVGHESIMIKTPMRWLKSIMEADEMLDEAGVVREYLTGDLFEGDPAYAVLFNGELWIP